MVSDNQVAWDEASHARSSEDAWSAFINSRFAPFATRKLANGPSIQKRMLEQELAMLKKYTCVALQCRNRVSGAAALPAEVLATIFALAQPGWPPYYRPKSFKLGWIQITHVCSAWRQTALQTPALWTKIPCPHLPPQMLPEIVRRSGRLPLALYADVPLFNARKIPMDSWLCESVMKRSGFVSIRGKSPQDTSIAINCLSSAKNALRSLTVELDITACEGEWALLEPDRGVYNLAYFPALRRLSLRGCFPEWYGTLPLPKGITHLSLAIDGVDIDTDSSYCPDAPRFKEVLETLPNLQELTLRNFLPTTPKDFDGLDITPVPLPYPFVFPSLQKLTFECDCSVSFDDGYEYFWNNFHVPHTAVVKVNLALDNLRSSGNYLVPITCLDNEICPAIEMTLSQHTVSARYAESAKETWTRRVDVETYLSAAVPLSKRWKYHEEHWDVDATYGSRHVRDADTNVSEYIETLPLASLRALFLSASAVLLHSPDFWIKYFATAQSVQRLSFNYPISFDLLVALSRSVDNDGRTLALFPQLDTLILHEDTGTISRMDHSLRSSLELELLDVLATRMACASPIKCILASKKLALWEVWGHIDQTATTVEFF